MWHFFRLYWPWLVRISCSVYFLKTRRCESCLFLYALERLLDLQCIPSCCKEASISTFSALHLLVPVGTQCPGAEITQIVVSREAKKTSYRSKISTAHTHVFCALSSCLTTEYAVLVCVRLHLLAVEEIPVLFLKETTAQYQRIDSKQQ